jgi:hypothetical protein
LTTLAPPSPPSSTEEIETSTNKNSTSSYLLPFRETSTTPSLSSTVNIHEFECEKKVSCENIKEACSIDLDPISQKLDEAKYKCENYDEKLNEILYDVKLNQILMNEIDSKVQSVNDQIANVYEVLRVYLIPPTNVDVLDKLLLIQKLRIKK